MKREEFDKILIEEGMVSKSLRDLIWSKRSTDDLDPKRVRDTARLCVVLQPEWYSKED